jgi:hypothetical protein
MGETDKSNDESPATSSAKDKRDREDGMFQDPLVLERTDKLENGLQETITAMRLDGRLIKVYEFIRKHRPGKPVRAHQTIRGGYNVLFHIEYTDGQAIMRVPLPGINAFGDEKVRNEVETLRYIEKMTSIPLPHVYHWGTAAENPLGLGPFIIMDYIAHDNNLEHFLRDPTIEDPKKSELDPKMPRDKLKRLYQQAAGIVLQLSQLEMPKIGSLQQHGDDFVVGSRPLTQEMNDIIVQGGIPPSVLPPENKTYSTSAEWYAALADMHFALLTFRTSNACPFDPFPVFG